MSVPITLRELREMFVFGIFIGAVIGLASGVFWGINIQRSEFERTGSAMDQAQKRHRQHLERADKRMDLIVQCAQKAEHLDDTSDKLAFCERQVTKW